MTDDELEAIRRRAEGVPISGADVLVWVADAATDRATLLGEVDRCRAILAKLGGVAVGEAEREIKRDALRRGDKAT